MRPDVDAALADATARATDPRPERRQNTALEVAEELAALQAHDVARAQARDGPRFWDRRALPAWAIGALVVAGAAASLHTLTESRARTAPGVTPTAAAELAGPLMQLTSGPHLTTESTVSPDGEWLAYASDRSEEGTETLLVRSREPLSPVISADGSRIAYSSSRERGFVVHAIPSSGGTSEVVCTECGGSFVHDWSNDNERLLYGSDEPTAVFTLEIESGEKRRVLARPPHSLWQPRFSPDDRWVSVLEALGGGFPTRIWIAPLHQDRASDPESWIAVTDGASWDDKPRWAADGNTLYFTSLRDGFHCLWAQRLQPDTKRPAGAPYPVRHFHTARLSMNNTGFIGLETAVSHDRLFINLGELSGNIWTTLLR